MCKITWLQTWIINLKITITGTLEGNCTSRIIYVELHGQVFCRARLIAQQKWLQQQLICAMAKLRQSTMLAFFLGAVVWKHSSCMANSSQASTANIYASMHRAWRLLCLLLSIPRLPYAECDWEWANTQCRNVLDQVQGMNCEFMEAGAANVVMFCHSPSWGDVAFRMCLLAEVDNHDTYFVSVEDMLDAFLQTRTDGDHMLLTYLQQGYQNFDRKSPRRLIPHDDFDGESKWLDEMQYLPLVFPPALPTSTCKACLPLRRGVSVFSLRQGGQKVSSISQGMVIGMRVMHKVTGSLASQLQNLTTLDAIVFIVAYHSDLRRMIQEGHLHDAHAGNVLLSSSSAQDRPIFRWHDFSQFFTKRHDPEELGRMAGQVLKVTRDIVDLLHQKESSLGVILNKTQFRCDLLQASHQGTRHVQECLAERAVKLGSDIMTSALDTDVKEEFLAIVSPALPDYARRKLQIAFSSGAPPRQSVKSNQTIGGGWACLLRSAKV